VEEAAGRLVVSEEAEEDQLPSASPASSGGGIHQQRAGGPGNMVGSILYGRVNRPLALAWIAWEERLAISGSSS
jgi:hypothetical protein